jgi:DNA-binding PadR family transcriptional regulator
VALKDALLVTPLDRPATSYELAEWFDAGVAHNRQANSPQLYQALSSMEDDGPVAGIEVAQRNRPGTSVMTISRRGRGELDRFVAQTLRSSLGAPRSVEKEMLA